MTSARHLLWLLPVLAWPIPAALAQVAPPPATSPPQGVLKPPPKGKPAITTPSAPPVVHAVPRAGVQQVAPFATPMPAPSVLGHSAPGQHARTPVVQPPHNVHAQKPGTPAATAQTPPAKPTSPKPVTPPVAAAPPPAAATPDKPPPAAAAEPPKGGSGLTLPRFAALRSDEVFLRVGPGTRYPVDWVYRRRDLPVEIEREYEVWRLVEDQDGVKGWVHQATLTGRRSFVVTGAERTLRRAASDDSAAVALLKPGVVGRIRSCEAGKTWCDMQVGDYRGWLRRDEVWGTYPSEAVN